MPAGHQHEKWQIQEGGDGPYCAACGERVPVDGANPKLTRAKRAALILALTDGHVFQRSRNYERNQAARVVIERLIQDGLLKWEERPTSGAWHWPNGVLTDAGRAIALRLTGREI